jgi:ATP-dependent Lhr-like helicase
MAALVELPQIEPEAAAALAWAHPVVAEWFLTKFGSATEPQIEGWPAILRGETTLISAPTGSGKTLAAFLVAIDHLLRLAIAGSLPSATQVLYISPLKALSNDVQKNLDGPLAEIQQLAAARGFLCPPIRTGVRTGDTLPAERARMLRNPPHILVTTPESLYLLLTAAKSRENLRHIRTVIVDEIHAVADDKRGAHLALSLERLDALVLRREPPLPRRLPRRPPHPTAAHRPLRHPESNLSRRRLPHRLRCSGHKCSGAPSIA